MKLVRIVLPIVTLGLIAAVGAQDASKTRRKIDGPIIGDIAKDRVPIVRETRLRVTYPPNNIWVPRGTGIVVRGTAKFKGYLIVDAIYEGTHDTYSPLPLLKDRWVKTASEPFADKHQFLYDAFAPNAGKQDDYSWVFDRIRTETTTQNISGKRHEWIPNKVRFTIYNANVRPPKPSKPTEHTQTITVEIRDNQ